VLGRLLWVKDQVSVITGGHGVQLLPRKLTTAKFLLQDFKSIKFAIPKVTCNDVLLGVIASGLSKYLDIKSSNGLQHALQLTAITPMNLRKHFCLQETSDLMMTRSKPGLCGWGNKSSGLLVPINCYKGLHPLEHVRAMKAIMEKKKQSFEAYFTYGVINFLVSYFGPK
ncbi:hypothetical protein SOVF_055390, partial [Spinacia oleracea]